MCVVAQARKEFTVPLDLERVTWNAGDAGDTPCHFTARLVKHVPFPIPLDIVSKQPCSLS
jgi:hypothetical protein